MSACRIFDELESHSLVLETHKGDTATLGGGREETNFDLLLPQFISEFLNSIPGSIG